MNREGPQSPDFMPIRDTSEGILKRCRNEGTKEIALTETEVKNRDHHGGVFKEEKTKRAKIQERISVIRDQWEKMSLRDVRKENMTGFWNILREKK